MISPRENILRHRNLHIIFAVTLFAVMGVSSITPAFPKIIRHFNITPKEIGLLITSFTLPGIFLTPFLGVLADRFGRKTILVPSLFIFGLAGSGCYLANTYETLLLLRFIQGSGAASLGSINITLIGDLYSTKKRAAAMGYNASVLSIGTASYPAIGGALATFSWNYPFLLPVLTIPLGLVVLFKLNNPVSEGIHSLREYLKNTWKNIRSRSVIGLFVINVCTFIILYGAYLTYFPVLLERDYKASALTIGLIMSFMSLSTAITSSGLGRLAERFSGKKLLYAGFSLYFISMTLIPLSSHLIMILLSVMLFGIAHGINMPNVQNLLIGKAPMKERAAFMSVNSMVLRTGQTIGPILIGFFYGMSGLRAAFFSAAVLAVLVIMLVIWAVE